MSQYNKLSDIQYARFQILPVELHFGLFWSAGIPTMIEGILRAKPDLSAHHAS